VEIPKPIPLILNCKYSSEVVRVYQNFVVKSQGAPAGFIMYMRSDNDDVFSPNIYSIPLMIHDKDYCLELINTVMLKPNFVRWI